MILTRMMNISRMINHLFLMMMIICRRMMNIIWVKERIKGGVGVFTSRSDQKSAPGDS